jgi:uncharacterized repeat protein (TIGR01451 family)
MVRLGVVFVLGLGLAAALLWVTGSVGDGVLPVVVRAAESPRRAQAAGDVYCVAPEGGMYSGCTQVFTSVQAAVDAAGGGETIKVAAGTYTDVQARPCWDTVTTGVVTQVVYVSKTVHIVGGYTTTNWDTSYPVTQPTTLDAESRGRGIYVTGDPSAGSGGAISVTIAGLRITSGDASGLGGCLGDVGGGVYVISASATIRDSQISGSYGMHGGGVGLCYSRLTFQKSRVIGNAPAYGGGGMFTWYSTATLSSSAIVSNHATAYGGGAWSIYSAITLSDSEVISNTSDDDGGGLQMQDCTSAFTESIISSNSAGGMGGGLMLWGGDYTLVESVIVSNTASEGGGLAAAGTFTLAGNTIARNSAGSHGGGVYLAGADAVLTRNTVTSNTVLDYGGGIDVEDSTVWVGGNVVKYNSASLGGGIALRDSGLLGAPDSEGTFDSNVIAHNTSSDVGGGLYVGSSPITLTNTLIHDNHADTKGSGAYIHSWNGEPARLVHSTVARNTGGDGSGIHVTDAYGAYGNVWLTNTILVSHTVGIAVAAGSTATLEATLWGTDTWGNGMDWSGAGVIVTGTPAHNWWAAPGFVDPDAGDYHLRPDSAAIDKGVDAGVATDVDGDARPMGAGPDLGADEAPRALYVDRDATGANDGSSWTDAYTDLQSALDVALPGDQVWVANGVYTPTQRTDAGDARTATFVLTDGVALYGGFAGGETALSQRDWEANVTVLSGDVDGNDTADGYGVITDTGGISGSNVYHVLVADGVTATAVLDGFWITGGYADTGTSETHSGGGMYVYGGSPTLERLVFSGNYGWNGGGLYIQYSNSSLTDIVFAGNAVVGGGGGLWIWFSNQALERITFRSNVASTGGGLRIDGSDVTLSDVVFERNAAGSGGGIYLEGRTGFYHSSLTVTDAVFFGNMAQHLGGGVFTSGDGALILSNGLFVNNSARDRGGLCSDWFDHAELTNVTFSGNTAEWFGAIRTSPPYTLTNCILWNNPSSKGPQALVGALYYSIAPGALYGTGANNLNADPLFVREPDPGPDGTWGTPDDDYGDLRLRPGSPAIDAGSNLSVPVSVTTDLAGGPRFLDVAGQPDTGLGAPPIVDMGAYEAAFADLAVSKAVMPGVVAPGDAITYTLSFSNAGSLLARGVVLTDVVPITVTVTNVYSSGVRITDTGTVSAAERVWAVADLAPGEGGAITIVGVVSPSVSGVFSLTNRVVIATTGEDWDAGNNVAHVSSTVDGRHKAYLPLVVRQK